MEGYMESYINFLNGVIVKSYTGRVVIIVQDFLYFQANLAFLALLPDFFSPPYYIARGLSATKNSS